jgi:Tfp pilus assembly protein PilO
MKKLNKEKRDHIILVAMATVIASAAIWFTLIQSQNANLVALAKRNAEQKQKLEAAEALLASKAEIKRRFDQADGRLKVVEKEMVNGDMYDWVIQTVKNFKSAYKHVEIPNYSREVLGNCQMIPNFPYKEATFNIRGTAYYHHFGRFIADFENRFPFVRIQNVDIEPASTSSATATDDQEKLSFKFELVALVNPTTPAP